MLVLALLFLLLAFPLLTLAPAGGGSSSDRGSFHTPPSFSSPASPPTPQSPPGHYPYPGYLDAQREAFRVIYPDEDAAITSMAWYNRRLGQGEAVPSGWWDIEGVLTHPREQHVERQSGQVEPAFTFGAPGESFGERRQDTATETGQQYDLQRSAESKDKGPLIGSPPGRSSTKERRAQRLRDASLRFADTLPRSRDAVQRERATSAIGSSFQQRATLMPPGATGWRSAGRRHSSVQETLQSARLKLAAYSESQASLATPPGSQPHSGRYASPTAPSSRYASARYGPQSAHDMPSQPLTPDAYPSDQGWYSGGSPIGSVPQDDAPYRMWSTEKALHSIGLRTSKLTEGHPPSVAHWNNVRTSMAKRDWGERVYDRLDWADRNRLDNTRSVRVVTPSGAVTGSEVAMGPPQFTDNPNDPAPPLDSILPTKTDRRFKAWRELANLVPPGLVGHSKDIFNKHANSDYKDMSDEFHRQVHPIQYLSQILRDTNGAPILENAIHDQLHQELSKTKPEVVYQLREHARVAGVPLPKEQSLEDLMGTRFTVPNRFWYDQKHPIEIRNPLDTPLEDFAAFRPFADAVALRDHI